MPLALESERAWLEVFWNFSRRCRTTPHEPSARHWMPSWGKPTPNLRMPRPPDWSLSTVCKPLFGIFSTGFASHGLGRFQTATGSQASRLTRLGRGERGSAWHSSIFRHVDRAIVDRPPGADGRERENSPRPLDDGQARQRHLGHCSLAPFSSPRTSTFRSGGG